VFVPDSGDENHILFLIFDKVEDEIRLDGQIIELAVIANLYRMVRTWVMS
jgi:hypothetical protein